MSKQMTIRLCFAKDTASNWTNANPILKLGEPGYEIDTGYFKIGNGINNWDELPYANKNSMDANGLTFTALQNKLNQLERENAIDKWRLAILEDQIEVPYITNDIELEGMLLKGGQGQIAEDITCENILNVDKIINLFFGENNLSLQNPFIINQGPSQMSLNEVNCEKEFVIINNSNLHINLGNITSNNKTIIKVNHGSLTLSNVRLKVDDVTGDAEGFDKTIDTEEGAQVYINSNCQFYKFNPTDNPAIQIANNVEIIQEGDWYKTIEINPSEVAVEA